MDRDKLAAIAALAILAGGGWWYLRARQSQPIGAGEGELFADVPLLAQLRDYFAPVVEPVVASIESAADDVMQAVSGGAWTPPAKAAPYLELIYAAEDAAGAPRNLFARQIRQESNFNPSAVNPRSGAQGIAQFMPATAAELGIDPFDPAQAIPAMGRYMKWLYGRHGDWTIALGAYNWGTGSVGKWQAGTINQKTGKPYTPPQETLDYMANISRDVGLA